MVHTVDTSSVIDVPRAARRAWGEQGSVPIHVRMFHTMAKKHELMAGATSPLRQPPFQQRFEPFGKDSKPSGYRFAVGGEQCHRHWGRSVLWQDLNQIAAAQNACTEQMHNQP
ncbi:hypothetical protein KM188_11435 [Mycetohabitans sp. B4]|nr:MULTISPECIES: hypothetical protein [Burkholderiaceae]MCG1019300.1 hypothetical protein [Mycetohabitans sp. B4]MCG1040095.1 hypothetical protein [Mycetohabitans sp. B7]